MLSDRPEVEKLEGFLEPLLQTRGDEVEFAVLFGSMARGNWLPGSDYDVLIGLREDDGKRLIDRIYEFSPWERGILRCSLMIARDGYVCSQTFIPCFWKCLSTVWCYLIEGPSLPCGGVPSLAG